MGDLGIVITFITVGQDHVMDINALLTHEDGGTAARYIRVVRVRHDYKDVADTLPVRLLPLLLFIRHGVSVPCLNQDPQTVITESAGGKLLSTAKGTAPTN